MLDLCQLQLCCPVSDTVVDNLDIQHCTSGVSILIRIPKDLFKRLAGTHMDTGTQQALTEPNTMARWSGASQWHHGPSLSIGTCGTG